MIKEIPTAKDLAKGKREIRKLKAFFRQYGINIVKNHTEAYALNKMGKKVTNV